MESDDNKMINIDKNNDKNQRLLSISVSFFILYYNSLPSND